jgi:hypothetical protein
MELLLKSILLLKLQGKLIYYIHYIFLINVRRYDIHTFKYMDIIQSILIMKVNKRFSWVAISLGVAFLAVLLIVNVNTAYSDSNKSQEELAFKDKAVEIMKIDTNVAKPVYLREVYDESIAELSSDIRYKCVHALTSLSMDGTHRNGDFMPVFFIEGNDKVSIAIKHDDGTLTLDEFDISGKNPVKTNQIVKEQNNDW